MVTTSKVTEPGRRIWACNMFWCCRIFFYASKATLQKLTCLYIMCWKTLCLSKIAPILNFGDFELNLETELPVKSSFLSEAATHRLKRIKNLAKKDKGKKHGWQYFVHTCKCFLANKKKESVVANIFYEYAPKSTQHSEAMHEEKFRVAVRVSKNRNTTFVDRSFNLFLITQLWNCPRA